MREPDPKRAITFIDGQNLFHAARAAFGYRHPNYDVVRLSEAVCRAHNWTLCQVRFYTGVPDLRDDARWHAFWSKKLSVMGKMGVAIYSRPLRYRNRVVLLPDGTEYSFLAGEEKGIDVRISLDVIRHAMHNRFDVGVIFSQDQDFSEVAEEIRAITAEQNRWIKIACAFPSSLTSRQARGINKTDWIRLDRTTYEACLDRRDYFRTRQRDSP